MKKKKILNILMVIAIVLIIISGGIIVANIKGIVGNNNSPVTATKKGNVSILRNGISYSLTNGIVIRNNDSIETKKDSNTTISIDDAGYIVFGENTKVNVYMDDNEITFEVIKGELFANIDNESKYKVNVAFDDINLSTDKCVYSIDILDGSRNINVYKNSLFVNGDEITTKNQGVFVIDSDNKYNLSICSLSINSLNNFLVNCLIDCKNIELCFSSFELINLLSERTSQGDVDINGNLIVSLDESVSGGGENVIGSSSSTENVGNIDQNISNDQKSSSTSTNTTNNVSDKNSTSNSDESSKSNNTSTDNSGNNNSSESTSSNVSTCTVTVRCDTILDNIEKLTEGKETLVPSNGVILSTVTVEFKDGETVFDVLKRALNANGIQLEYSWTPMYGSYYIEGINNLYEFDCGEQSGWMYKVNGWFPNYGCSSYYLKQGDVIVWCYTCNGLGEDVGAPMY